MSLLITVVIPILWDLGLITQRKWLNQCQNIFMKLTNINNPQKQINMAKTKEIFVNCANVTISPNGGRAISVSLDEPDVDGILGDIDKDDLTEYVERNFEVDAVFSETDLEKWAEANGYVKGTDNED